jgi:serine/threonine protein kinase/Tol biopolymer transport system component
MPLAPSARLGSYEILSAIGAGGMGEVYRARDTKLGRDVAIKVLPDAFAHDAERMARFEREAQVLASLNHPNIATIHGLEESNGVRALVMELVEGPTLADRIAQGPVPLDEALALAKQIAEGLEYAHEKGVIHRDLKPANIKVTRDGTVKLLDFGLAKAVEEPGPQGNPSVSPTLTMQSTRAGVILGTASYMSPEQARGKRVDKRADIWAFGVVLYELLTGKRLFEGQDTSEMLAAVIKEEPKIDDVPANVRTLLRACLEKDPKKRLRDIGDSARLLDVMPKAMDQLPARQSKWPWAVAGAAMLLATVAVVLWAPWKATGPAPHPLMRLDADLGAEISSVARTPLAISPDGTRLAFISRGSNGKDHLALKLLHSSQVMVLADTEGAGSPFFSPDSRWVAFFADGKLKKVSVEGGSPLTLANAHNPRGGTWGEDGNILFAAENRVGLSRISASGGTPQPATELDVKQGEISNRYPQLLPGGEAILFTARTAQEDWDQAAIKVQVIKTGQRKTLVQGGYHGRYLPSGHLVYVHEGTLFAAPMNLKRLELSGPAAPVIEDIGSDSGNATAKFDFTPSGTFVYVAELNPGGQQTLFLLDASGIPQPLRVPPGRYSSVQLSPDGASLALLVDDDAGTHFSLYDLAQDRMARVSEFKAPVNFVIWTGDSKYLVFQTFATQLTGPGIYWVRADGVGEPTRLVQGKGWLPASFFPDGKRLTYWHGEPPYGLWTLPLDLTDPEHPKAGKPESLLSFSAETRGPLMSPDGRWMAYSSFESGRLEAYVRPYPGPGGERQISTDGGYISLWSPTGQELIYRSLDGRIWAVGHSAKGDSFVVGQSHLWSEKGLPNLRIVGMLPDGKRLVIGLPSAQGVDQKPSTHVVFLLNFFDALPRGNGAPRGGR